MKGSYSQESYQERWPKIPYGKEKWIMPVA